MSFEIPEHDQIDLDYSSAVGFQDFASGELLGVVYKREGSVVARITLTYTAPDSGIVAYVTRTST